MSNIFIYTLLYIIRISDNGWCKSSDYSMVLKN